MDHFNWHRHHNDKFMYFIFDVWLVMFVMALQQAREPKIVNGPEIFDRYVGGSEENIRALFADAEKEYEEAGDASHLHVIILDEIDAICKQRGSSSGSTGVNDSVVNQLLSKIDGVDALNNILLIGMDIMHIERC